VLEVSQPHRILYVSPVAEQGGAETVLLHLLRLHDRRRFTPVVVLLKSGPLASAVEALGVEASVFPVRRFRDLAGTTRAVLGIRRMIRRDKVDVVFGNMAMGHVYGGLAALGTAARTVWFQHGIVERADTIDRLAAALPASATLACSAAAARAQARRTPASRIVVVRGGVDHATIETGGAASGIRRELGLPSDARVIACIGRLQEWKGQRLFVRAVSPILAQDPRVHVLVVGGTLFGLEESYAVALRADVMKSPAPGRVHLLGHRTDVASILGAVDLFVHCPLQPEPFGLVLVEAMAAGIPVIASRAGGPEEIVVDGESGLLVTPGDADALTAAIARLLANAEERTALARAGLRRARECFTAERMVHEVEDVLARVVAA
jgi:glycosyltransferase involved in cell wall biosynthesis